TIDRFELKGQLGQGAFGTVYEAIDTVAGTRCALKVASIDDKKRADSLQRESEALTSVNHPGIVKVFGHGTDLPSGLCWVAIELVDGSSIAAHIKVRRNDSELDEQYLSFDDKDSRKTIMPKPLAPLSRADLLTYVEWFRQGASALSAMEEAGLVHRDIKPQNLMVGNDGGLHLIDFGLSFELFESDVRGILAGTVPYMSPEQTQTGFAGHDGRSDIYSLAVSFWELLTGVQAVGRGSSRSGLLLQIVHNAIPPVAKGPGVPASLNPIFERALMKDVRLRYQKASELERDLDAWLRDAALIYADEKIVQRTARQSRKHPFLASFAVLAVILVLGWVAWSGISNSLNRSAILDEARAIVIEGRWQEFSPFFAEHASMFEGDDEFLVLYRGAMPNVSGGMIDEMFARQGVVVKPLAHTSSHRKNRDEIAIHLKYCPSPELLGMAAFSEVMDGNFESALELIDSNKSINRNNLLIEIQLLCHLGGKNNGAFKALLGQLNAQESPTTQSLCVRAYRLFEQNHLSRTEQIELQSREGATGVWEKVEQTDFLALRKDLLAASDRTPRHRMLRFFRALVEHQLGRPQDAYPIFESLRLDSNSASDKIGTQLLQARSLIFAAHQDHGNPTELLAKAAQLAFNAIEAVPGLAERMSIWLTDLEGFKTGFEPQDQKLRSQFTGNELAMPWRTFHGWLMAMFSHPWPPESRPILGEATTYLASVAVVGASTEDQNELVLNLSEHFLEWYGSSRIPELEGRQDVLNFSLIVSWTYLHRGHAIVESGAKGIQAMGELLECGQKAGQTVEAEIGRGTSSGLTLEMAGAKFLASAYHALGAEPAPKRAELANSARAGLRSTIATAEEMIKNNDLEEEYLESVNNLLGMCKAAAESLKGIGE
ncbi:MAG: serine/threonine protein kinase, partial [Planctomycetota bacterium]